MDIIKSLSIKIEQKRFFIDYCANERGKFLRITEVAHGRRNTIIIPETGLSEFGDLLNDILDLHEGVAEEHSSESASEPASKASEEAVEDFDEDDEDEEFDDDDDES